MTVEEMVDMYDRDKCSIELRNRTWCLCKDGKIVYRISSAKKSLMLLNIIENRGVDKMSKNPYEMQMNKLRMNTSVVTPEVERTTPTPAVTTSPLFDRRKKDLKQIYSVKLQRELSDKLITLSMRENLSFTDIIEYGLEKVFEELDVIVNKRAVEEYNSTKGKRK